MKTHRMILTFILILNMVLITGCWNYRETDKIAVVSGVAIDKGTNEKFSITVEIVEISATKGGETKSKTITFEGKTIFDTARHVISVSGKRLYWSHAKIVIISKELAKEGVVQILDWFNRDSETRGDIHILISREKTAKEVLSAKSATEKVTAYELNDALDSQTSLSNAPHVEIWKITNYFVNNGVGATATAVNLKQVNGEEVPQIRGAAVFKGDRLIDFIDGDETMDMLFVQDEIKGGILVVEETAGNENTTVSLEIFRSKTKIKPVTNNGEIEMNVSIETTVAIDEIEETENVIEDEGRKQLEESAEKTLKNRINTLIKRMQSEYGVDIFGFGVKVKQDKPKVWKTFEHTWGDKFKNLKVNIDTKVHIKNSAMMAKPLEVGD